ncbi:hypothetical protein Cgig2_007741 [Carnegiea gigantea]|uniref:Uncharacterized protein n=1 Tax=Carnegiea gigantea TaxID=171969 RepID=A0A9Q1K7S5_9CARY|nr:hypothetical protein Cgig2_007741 [Carnegiea gigantea]
MGKRYWFNENELFNFPSDSKDVHSIQIIVLFQMNLKRGRWVAEEFLESIVLLGSPFHAIIAAAFLFTSETSSLDVEVVENFLTAKHWPCEKHEAGEIDKEKRSTLSHIRSVLNVTPCHRIKAARLRVFVTASLIYFKNFKSVMAYAGGIASQVNKKSALPKSVTFNLVSNAKENVASAVMASIGDLY